MPVGWEDCECVIVCCANFYFENSIRCKFLYRKFPIDWVPCKTVTEIYWWECEMAKSCSQRNATGLGWKCIVFVPDVVANWVCSVIVWCVVGVRIGRIRDSHMQQQGDAY